MCVPVFSACAGVPALRTFPAAEPAGAEASSTAAELDVLLNSASVTRAQAARFVLAAADIPPGNAAGGAAFDAAKEKGWLPARAEAEGPATLGELSLLVMKAFGIKGGLMYTLFGGSRYACRELVHLRIVQEKNDPGARPDGEEFLRFLGRALTYSGEDEVHDAGDARRRLLEDVSDSLRDAAKQSESFSGGAEDIQGYEGEFQLE
ncbi:MAG: hypothetical protein LBI86_04185 [Treponema sp.]|nr:hypothetical protein [Treponema sp.]